MFYGNEEDRRKGNGAEEKFREWLERHSIPYIYIRQDSNTTSSAFKNNFHGKRPDFMILILHLGFIFVDVKYKKLNPPYNTHPVDADETKKYSSLQRRFNLQILYALSNEGSAYKTWLWIPVSKVLEAGILKHISSKSRGEFFSVPANNFIQLADDDSLERLFSKLYR